MNQFKSMNQQRGSVAIFVAATLTVLIAFVGLTVDLGHLYIGKTELQNAADAGALSAVKEMGDGTIASLQRAANAGVKAMQSNFVNLQGKTINATTSDITFAQDYKTGPWLSLSDATASASTASQMNYVKASPQSGSPESFSMWFMQVVGFGNQTVSARAIAGLTHAQSNCALPVAICSTGTRSASPSYGIPLYKWLQSIDQSGSSATGNFGWVDFSPPSGGASELAQELAVQGQCDLKQGDAAGKIGQTGGLASLEQAWNTRFGLYKGSYNISNIQTYRPDYSGCDYTAANSTKDTDVYTSQYKATQKPNNTPFSGRMCPNPSMSSLNSYTSATQSQLQQYGTNRRVTVAPIVDCTQFSSSQTASLLDWACVFMLNPMDLSGKTKTYAWLEYLGLASDAASPCKGTTVGMPGGNGNGPLIPTLVQ